MKELKLTRCQELIAASRAKIVLAACGRRFGKEIVAYKMAYNQILKDNSVVVWAGVTKDLIAKTAFETFISLCPNDKIEKINKEELDVLFKNGSCIYFVDFESVNPGADLTIFDEYAYYRKNVFSNIENWLDENNTRCLIISTPKGRDNHFHDLFVRLSIKENCETFRFTSLQGWLEDRESIKRAKETMSDKLFEQEFLAEFVDL